MKHITVSAECRKIDNHQVLASVAGLQNLTVIASTEAKAREDLTARTLLSLQEHDRIARNYQRAAIGCKDGTVLIVRFAYDAWGYDIYGPNRDHSSSCSSNNKKFEEELADARAHANSSYGGIAWECR